MSIISVNTITKSFDKHHVLKGIDLTVDKGEIFGFLGPNGAGKTTTMRIILGLLSPDSGTATVLGSNLARCPDLRAKIGVVLDKKGLYDALTVYDNLMYAARMFGVPNSEKTVLELLERSGSENLHSTIAGKLSTGTKKRIELIRALLHSPEVLFLDEPTSGLDPQAQKDFRETLSTLVKNRSLTVFMSTHNLDEARRLCSRVAILNQGRIEYNAPVSSLDATDNQAVYSIMLSNVHQVEQAIALLVQDPSVASAHLSGGEIIVTLKSGQTRFPLQEVTSAGISIEGFSRKKQSLEDIYFSVT